MFKEDATWDYQPFQFAPDEKKKYHTKRNNHCYTAFLLVEYAATFIEK